MAHLQQFPERLATSMVKAMNRVTIGVQALVKSGKLSGQVLHVRTGTLRRSINQEVRYAGSGLIEGIVGTNVEYAHVHEYGFHGTVSVKEHLRMQKVAWGKAMKNPREVTVKAHNMTMNTPGKRFLRDALAENAELIRETYRKAVNRGLQP